MQIEAYIRSIGLNSSMSNGKNSFTDSNIEAEEQGRKNNFKKSVDKQAKKGVKNRDSCGGKQEVQRKEIKNKRTSRLTDSDVVTRGSGGQMAAGGSRSEKEKVEKQLLSLSVSPQTKLLVSPDSQQLWFDQVSPPIAGQQLCSNRFHIVITV